MKTRLFFLTLVVASLGLSVGCLYPDGGWRHGRRPEPRREQRDDRHDDRRDRDDRHDDRHAPGPVSGLVQ